MNAAAHPTPTIAYVIAAVIFVGLLAFRMRRMMTATPYDPYRAWLLPLLFVLLSGLALFGARPAGADWLWVLGALAIGAVVGWLRGRAIAITVDPATGRLLAQGSAWAIAFIVILLVIRFGGRYLLSNDAAQLGLRPIMADVLSAVMGAGIFVARGLEMGVRGHRLLAANRRAAPPVT